MHFAGGGEKKFTYFNLSDVSQFLDASQHLFTGRGGKKTKITYCNLSDVSQFIGCQSAFIYRGGRKEKKVYLFQFV